MSTGLLERLAWDSNHFGLVVARLSVPDQDPATAWAALEQARREGIALVYWASRPDQEVPADLQAAFHGYLVDRKATFRRALEVAPPEDTGRLRVVHYPAGPASPALRALGVAAGEYSRFRVDPYLPEERFIALYETWIDRAARGELADAVLVAVDGDIADPLGMITVKAQDEGVSIGLIAVAARARGRGVGKVLMAAAHAWMHRRGARYAEVVTQQTNIAACRLYETSGYHLDDLTLYYHFWPLVRPDEPAWISPL